MCCVSRAHHPGSFRAGRSFAVIVFCLILYHRTHVPTRHFFRARRRCLASSQACPLIALGSCAAYLTSHEIAPTPNYAQTIRSMGALAVTPVRKVDVLFFWAGWYDSLKAWKHCKVRAEPGNPLLDLIGHSGFHGAKAEPSLWGRRKASQRQTRARLSLSSSIPTTDASKQRSSK